MKEVDKKEILELEEGTQYVIYNPYTNSLKIETVSKKDIAHNKYCITTLKFYIKKDETTNRRV